MEFLNWFINENQTVAQFLKDPRARDKVPRIKKQVSEFLAQHIFNQNEKVFLRYVNWFTKEIIVQELSPHVIPEMLDTMWDEIGAYIITKLNNNQIQSRFSLKDFTYTQVVELSQEWHAELNDPKATREGAEGRTIIDCSDLTGFQGWRWVALDRGYCEREGQAAGHCGNADAKKGDNIYSLRDPQNRVHLTFIANRGVLGEMKGRGNSKPAEKYHPPIIKLLLSDFIGCIRGGGYLAQNNFQIYDLPKEQQDMLLKKKRYLLDFEGFQNHTTQLARFYLHSRRRKDLGNAETDQDLATAISNIGYRRQPDNITMPYELEPNEATPPPVVGRHKVWRAYEAILDETYRKAKRMPPQQLFDWMDRAMSAFMKITVQADMEMVASLVDKHLFPALAGILKLDEVIYRLFQTQPQILRGAPPRSRYSSWAQYYEALTTYVNNMGYDLPPWNPNNNHIISYEFVRRMAEELNTQGKMVLDAINKIYQDSGGDYLGRSSMNMALQHRDMRMHDPEYQQQMRRSARNQAKAEREERRYNRQRPSWPDED